MISSMLEKETQICISDTCHATLDSCMNYQDVEKLIGSLGKCPINTRGEDGNSKCTLNPDFQDTFSGYPNFHPDFASPLLKVWGKGTLGWPQNDEVVCPLKLDDIILNLFA